MNKDPFKEYIRESEPGKRDKGYAWHTAIGLQAVDGLQTSEYLLQTAVRNIEGEISFEETTEAPMPDLGFKVFKLSESNFKQWREIHGSEQEQWKQQTIDFLNPVAENATIDNMVYELLLKNGKSLNSAINHINNCYIINDGELLLLLESVDQDTIDYVLSLHPQKVIALDNLFSGNDQLKTNTALQLRDAGIHFKTI